MAKMLGTQYTSSNFYQLILPSCILPAGRAQPTFKYLRSAGEFSKTTPDMVPA